MSFPMYHHNGIFYLLIQKGMSFYVAIECHNSNNKFISKDDLNQYDEIKLNSSNINIFLKALGKNNVAYSDRDEYLLYNNNMYPISNWRDVFNIIRS